MDFTAIKIWITYVTLYAFRALVDGEKTVNMILLVPYRQYHQTLLTRWLHVDNIRPVMDRALAKINETQQLPGVTVKLHVRDTKCSDTTGPIEAIELYMRRQASVFFGPVCHYAVAPVARFSYFWGIPVITPGALPPALGDKSEFRLLTRIGCTYQQAGRLFAKIMDFYGWIHIGLLYYNERETATTGTSDYWYLASSIFDEYKRLKKSHLIFQQGFDSSKNSTFLQKMLLDASNKSRGKQRYRIKKIRAIIRDIVNMPYLKESQYN